MKITQPGPDSVDKVELRQALVVLVEKKHPSQEAPCPNCVQHLPSRCSSTCDSAPAALSSEPQIHPLEPKTVPLVFEMTASGVAQPCWSCEGHLDHDEKLWRLPQVSFYVSHPVYAQLIHKYISRLAGENKLAYEWHIVVSDYGQLNGVTYTLQPNLNCIGDPRLGLLQQDMLVLSKDFAAGIKSLASDSLSQL